MQTNVIVPIVILVASLALGCIFGEIGFRKMNKDNEKKSK